jgi:hypothetical protein
MQVAALVVHKVAELTHLEVLVVVVLAVLELVDQRRTEFLALQILVVAVALVDITIRNP